MECPFDATSLQVVNRSGIEIDWCPSCKGVWLERGELDKLIEQASAPMPPPMPAPVPAGAVPDARRDARRPHRDDDYFDDDDRRRGFDDDRDDDDRHGSRRPRKRTSMLSEIFDF
mgnify:CR=1 FL=1